MVLYPGSAKLFPDLQKYFNKYLKTNQLDRYEIPIPGEIYNEHFPECRSFIRMLFDDDWNFPNYTHCYTKIEDKLAWPVSIRDRLMVYTHTEYYLPCCDSTNLDLVYLPCDATSSDFLNIIDHNLSDCCIDSTASTNIFNLESNDFLLLNALNIYRCDSTSVIVYEQENVVNSLVLLPDEQKWLLSISFNSLTSPLSKLIFLYLNLMINNDYLFYQWDGTNYLSNNLFEHLYEIYVIDNVFQEIVKNGPDLVGP